MKHIHVFISGKVQGVNFRYHLKRQAEEGNVFGWVRNLPDGRVEAVFEGEKDQLNNILAWCMIGPERAQVEGIEKFQEQIEGLTSFEILTN